MNASKLLQAQCPILAKHLARYRSQLAINPTLLDNDTLYESFYQSFQKHYTTRKDHTDDPLAALNAYEQCPPNKIDIHNGTTRAITSAMADVYFDALYQQEAKQNADKNQSQPLTEEQDNLARKKYWEHHYDRLHTAIEITVRRQRLENKRVAEIQTLENRLRQDSEGNFEFDFSVIQKNKTHIENKYKKQRKKYRLSPLPEYYADYFKKVPPPLPPKDLVALKTRKDLPPLPPKRSSSELPSKKSISESPPESPDNNTTKHVENARSEQLETPVSKTDTPTRKVPRLSETALNSMHARICKKTEAHLRYLLGQLNRYKDIFQFSPNENHPTLPVIDYKNKQDREKAIHKPLYDKYDTILTAYRKLISHKYTNKIRLWHFYSDLKPHEPTLTKHRNDGTFLYFTYVMNVLSALLYPLLTTGGVQFWKSRTQRYFDNIDFYHIENKIPAIPAEKMHRP